MISGEHAVIRTADPDDAYALRCLYDASRPRFAMLDRRREMLAPTTADLREVLARKEEAGEALYSIEDKCGSIQGFCTLRGGRKQPRFSELVLMLFSDEAYDSAVAEEVVEHLVWRAFVEEKMIKLIAHCVDYETGLRGLLIRKGFVSDGRQREVLFTQGHWHDIETLSLFPQTG